MKKKNLSERDICTKFITTALLRADCHRSVAHPASNPPSRVQDAAVGFIARLIREPYITCVFGRGLGMEHGAGRDDETPADMARGPWKATWLRCIRGHYAEFVARTLANGVSLSEQADTLGVNSFVPPQGKAARSEGSRRACRQQPAVVQSRERFSGVSDRLPSMVFCEHHFPSDFVVATRLPTIQPTIVLVARYQAALSLRSWPRPGEDRREQARAIPHQDSAIAGAWAVCRTFVRPRGLCGPGRAPRAPSEADR
jgi:hypothetical protein